MQNDEIVVSICCMAYNHESYIRKCIDSFLMQKTDFRFEVIIHDDASTDNTAQIIKEYERKYPEIIKPIYQTENQFSKGVSIPYKYQYPVACGKYIALCEGDDFWTDELKLQKQVDFLERNEDCVLCGHAAYYADNDSMLSKDTFFSYGMGTRIISTNEIIAGWVMATNSMVFKKIALDTEAIPYKGDAFNGDYALMTYLSLKGKVFFMDELMSAYRVESIGSITYGWKQDRKKRVDADERLLAMLDRLNKYTNFVYEDSVIKKQSVVLYCLLLDSRSIDEYKKYKLKYINIFNSIELISRFKLFLNIYFSGVYKLLKMVKQRIL